MVKKLSLPRETPQPSDGQALHPLILYLSELCCKKYSVRSNVSASGLYSRNISPMGSDLFIIKSNHDHLTENNDLPLLVYWNEVRCLRNAGTCKTVARDTAGKNHRHENLISSTLTTKHFARPLGGACAL
ncbi:hypothetical protein BaRGS_00015780 [Batillaria attramentaria]|uniref:Uncharacterized protein n=1 Tax=Batillaria attramentaria TaxID=370345 RepID=A0ABD0L0Z3_9CAEN